MTVMNSMVCREFVKFPSDLLERINLQLQLLDTSLNLMNTLELQELVILGTRPKERLAALLGLKYHIIKDLKETTQQVSPKWMHHNKFTHK